MSVLGKTAFRNKNLLGLPKDKLNEIYQTLKDLGSTNGSAITNITSNGGTVTITNVGSTYNLEVNYDYVVGNISKTNFPIAKYNSINIAIGQAVADGYNSTNPVNIYIKPNGNYNEPIYILPEGINLIGLGEGFDANVPFTTYNMPVVEGCIITEGNNSINNLVLIASNLNNNYQNNANAEGKSASIKNCIFSNSLGSKSIEINNLNLFNLNIDNCSFNSNSNIYLKNVLLRFENSYIKALLEYVSLGVAFINNCVFEDRLILDNSSAIIKYCTFENDLAIIGNIELKNNANVKILHSSFVDNSGIIINEVTPNCVITYGGLLSNGTINVTNQTSIPFVP